MSLCIYDDLKAIPNNISVINENDLYFNAHTLLRNDDITNMILNNVEKAKYVSETTFSGRNTNNGAIYKELLSTGTKTLLNIYYNPNKCFNVIECGDNAIDNLLTLKSGNVFWDYITLIPEKNSECDIVYQDKHFSDIFSFCDYVGEANENKLQLQQFVS